MIAPKGTSSAPLRRMAIPRHRALLFGILLLSLGVRVVYVLQSQGSPAFTQPSMDALYHLEWARAFSAGQPYQPGPFFRAPLYPWFLGALIRLFGERLLLVRLVQAAIGTTSVGLVYLVGARAFDRRTGLLAALFAGLYWVIIYFEGELLLPVLEIFFDLLAIWLSLRIEERLSPSRAALAGIAWGAACLVRPNVLLFAPLVLAWIVLLVRRARRTGTARLLVPAAFAVALAAPILSVTAYNRIVGKDWVLVSSQGGVNFWIGNNPRSDGSSAVVPGTRLDWWGGYYDSIQMAEAEEGRALKPSEVSSHYSRKAWAWIGSDPRAALAHALWKLRLFWTDWELSNNASESFFANRYGPLLRWLPLGFGALAPLALLGFLLAARAWRRILPLWGFLPVYTASVVAFFVCSRFRVPVLPAMAVLAAHACWRLLGMIREKRLLPLAASLAFLAAAIGVVERVPASIDRSDSKGLWQLGVTDSQRGDLDRAVEHFRASIALNDRYSIAHQDLGIALRQLGQTREAEESLRRAITVDPGNVVALSTLFDLLFASGRLDEARKVAGEAVLRSPVYASARYDLGRLLLLESQELQDSGAESGAVKAKLEEGLQQLRAGLELSRDEATTFNCGYVGGKALLKLGRPGEAAAAFERSLGARPDPNSAAQPDAAAWWWECQASLLEALDAAGRGDEARAHRAELVRRFPDDPRAAKLGAAAGR
jgi:tetratricopeptide (TPR) repeat protein